MNLDHVRRNPSYYTACQWCIGTVHATSCTCTEPCSRPNCPLKEDQELLPAPQPVPRFL